MGALISRGGASKRQFIVATLYGNSKDFFLLQTFVWELRLASFFCALFLVCLCETSYSDWQNALGKPLIDWYIRVATGQEMVREKSGNCILSQPGNW